MQTTTSDLTAKPANIEQETLLIDIASRNVVSLPLGGSVAQAAKLMADNRISSIVIVDPAGHPAGIVTERSVILALHDGYPAGNSLEHVMSGKVVSVPEHITCIEAYQICMRESVRHLVIVNQENQLVGVVSETDFRLHLNLSLLAGRLQVASVMNQLVLTVLADSLLQDSLSLLSTSQETCLVVVEAQCPIGIITERDLVRIYANQADPSRLLVSQIMSHPVQTISQDDSVNVAAEKMLQHKLRHLVVVDKYQRLAGLICEHDLTQAMVSGLINDQQQSERRRMEAEIIRSREDLAVRENAFRTLVENTPDMIARYGRGCCCLYANPALLKTYGLELHSVIGMAPIHSFGASPSSLLFQENIKRVAATGETADFLYHWRNEAGQTLYVNYRMFPEFNAAQRIISVLAIGQDVTGRHQAEAEMKKSISLLNATLDSSFDAVLVVNLNDTWELYNQKFVDLWQLPDEIVAAKNDRIALAHVLDQIVDPDAFIRRINELYDAPEISSCEMIALKNGKIIERFAYPQCIDNEVVGRVWTFRDVTLRENIEQTLKMEAQKNLALLHSASDGIHILDQNGIIIEVSDAFCAMLGYQREEMIGMYISEWDAVLNDAEIKQRLKARINLPGRSQFQTCHRRKDGGIINVEVSVVPLYLGDELVLFNSSRDITERKRAEKRISESENKYRLLIELAKDAIFLADAQSHTIIDCNISATKLLGKPKDEIIGLHQSKIHPPEKIEYYQQIFRSHIESGKDIAEDVMVLHHEGYHIPVDIHASVFYLDDRQVVLGIFREISDRKRAEAEMRIAATAFESQEGMLVTDDAGVILRVNRAFTEITGYMADEVIGKSPKMLSSGYHDRQFYAEIRDCIANSGSWDGEIWDKRKNGEIFPQHLSITAVKNEAGSVTNYVATFIDITSSKAAEDEIRSLAFYDALTGLPNRRLLLDRLGQALATSLRSGRSGAVLFLDLDHFKILNDTMGHDVGDLLLIQVAERLKECVREGDTVARLGGDEFIVMLEDLSEESTQAAAQVETISHKILTYLNQTYQLGKNEYRSASSIGIVIFNDDKFTQEDLLKQADIAMYQAKKSGRNTLRFFDPKMQEAISARVALERELRIALSEEQFQLHYQIQVDQFNRPIGAEVLLRWRHPEKGLLSPIEFIAVAEETGLILPIGLWVLDSACAQLMLWQQEARTEHLSLSVNVSAKQFRQDDFADQVRSMIARRRINTTKLKLELTESILMDNIEDTIMTMNVLRNLGVQFSLDDFGTGYSSLQYLKQLPLDQLKIDQTFVRDIVDDAHDRSIVRTIIAMANSLELNVIAEGVELIEQREILLNKGCTLYQGFLFGQPVSISEFENNLETLPFIFSGLPKK